jgi:hypothetical protein
MPCVNRIIRPASDAATGQTISVMFVFAGDGRQQPKRDAYKPL